jgi:hypothetical protein
MLQSVTSKRLSGAAGSGGSANATLCNIAMVVAAGMGTERFEQN